jgi:DNA-binding transcriptional LysR family regulator
MINPLWLKTYCTLVELGHFTHTATALFMTQSGVSQHIQKLEQQLDVALLLREGKSFTLTDAGSRLYQSGKKLLQESDDLATSIKQDDPYIGNIRVSSPGSVGLKLYPQLLDIQQTHPKLSLDYTFAPNNSIETALIDRKIDIGLMTETPKTSKLNSQEIALEPLVLVTSNKVTEVNWQILTTLGFILHPDVEHHANLLLSENFNEFKHIDQFEHKGFSNQISLILEPVSRNIGFTILPLHAVNAFHKPKHIRIQPLAKPVSENLYLCQNKNAFESARNKQLKAIITDFLSER